MNLSDPLQCYMPSHCTDAWRYLCDSRASCFNRISQADLRHTHDARYSTRSRDSATR